MNEVVQVRMNGWAAMIKQKNESGMTVKGGRQRYHTTRLLLSSPSASKRSARRDAAPGI